MVCYDSPRFFLTDCEKTIASTLCHLPTERTPIYFVIVSDVLLDKTNKTKHVYIKYYIL